ncbi:HTH domain-containing protein [Streptomyces galilaeus]|uniref:HTH domain-containing protein n=1 Tax=Streptomyces galilaeus TaxID=33899 RepID=A0ABW9IYN2_STRGJ
MSPASARTLRRRRVAELRAAEPSLSLRQMADRLGISRDTVKRDLDEIDREAAASAPPATPADEPVRPVDDSAPQASAGGSPASATPAAEPAPPAEPGSATVSGRSAETAPADATAVRPLPRRVSRDELVIDLAGWPALRRDLTVLEQSGRSPEALISQAVVVLAFGYRQALDSGRVEPGEAFIVRDMTVVPAEQLAARPAVSH